MKNIIAFVKEHYIKVMLTVLAIEGFFILYYLGRLMTGFKYGFGCA